jgi:hypothetical protein
MGCEAERERIATAGIIEIKVLVRIGDKRKSYVSKVSNNCA